MKGPGWREELAHCAVWALATAILLALLAIGFLWVAWRLS